MSKGKRILLTGATGFLGSHLMAGLLERGYPLSALVRPKGEVSADERIGRLLDWLGVAEADRAGLDVIDGRIDQPGLALPPEIYSGLTSRIEAVIHCASETSFSERKRAAVERANILGLENMLDLAVNGKCSRFHYISTAYAAGKQTGYCREELAAGESFHNLYEESKYRAERIAWERCGRNGIRLVIYRPSIVYGNSVTGRTFRFNALYYPVRTVVYLKELFETDIRERGGVHAREMGVRANGNGTLYLPIRVGVVEGGGLNLIPIDYFIDAFMTIMENSPEGGVFHLVNSRNKRIEELIDYVHDFFRIEGLKPCPHSDPADGPRNPLEGLFDSYLDIYAPYMRDVRVFEDSKTRFLLANKEIACPDFDYKIFSRCMAYAIETDWGRKIERHNSPLRV